MDRSNEDLSLPPPDTGHRFREICMGSSETHTRRRHERSPLRRRCHRSR
jgi:hypothetical protein